MRLLLERCPSVQIRLVVDGTGALHDPRGLDHEALSAIVLEADADAFDPARLSPGGFLLYRNARRTEGLRELYRRVERTSAGLRRTGSPWTNSTESTMVSSSRSRPTCSSPPAGGRRRWTVEGANSFIGKRAFTDISSAISLEINGHKARLFQFFRSRPDLVGKQLYRRALLEHLPRLVRESPSYRLRVKDLPAKYRSAILAAEIATTMVYRQPLEPNFEEALEEYVGKMFS
jgi:hypothetical protein